MAHRGLPGDLGLDGIARTPDVKVEHQTQLGELLVPVWMAAMADSRTPSCR